MLPRRTGLPVAGSEKSLTAMTETTNASATKMLGNVTVIVITGKTMTGVQNIIDMTITAMTGILETAGMLIAAGLPNITGIRRRRKSHQSRSIQGSGTILLSEIGACRVKRLERRGMAMTIETGCKRSVSRRSVRSLSAASLRLIN
jgi:hypothetical protein